MRKLETEDLVRFTEKILIVKLQFFYAVRITTEIWCFVLIYTGAIH